MATLGRMALLGSAWPCQAHALGPASHVSQGATWVACRVAPQQPTWQCASTLHTCTVASVGERSNNFTHIIFSLCFQSRGTWLNSARPS